MANSSPSSGEHCQHHKCLSFTLFIFRSFILSRPARGKLKKRGILRERVFGCDLGEHLLNSGNEGATPFKPPSSSLQTPFKPPSNSLQMVLLVSLVIGISRAKKGWSSARRRNVQPAKSLPLIILKFEMRFLGQAVLLSLPDVRCYCCRPILKRLKLRNEKECASPDLSRRTANQLSPAYQKKRW